MNTNWRRVLAAPCAIVGLVACGTASIETVEPVSALENLETRLTSVARTERPYSTLALAMPNVSFSTSDGAERSASDLFVLGRVVDVTAGVGMNWLFEGEVERTVFLPFDSDEARVSTIHLVVEVDQYRSRDAQLAPGERIIVGVALDPRVDVAVAREEFVGLGKVGLFLVGNSPVFAYDESVLSIVEDGGLLAVVGADDSLSLPMLDEADAAELLQATPDLPSLLLNSTEITLQMPAE